MDTKTIVIIVAIAVLVIVMGSALIFFLVKYIFNHSVKQKEEIMKNTPKRTFEFLDAFYADTTLPSMVGESHLLEFVIKDVDTDKIYLIDSVNCVGFCFKDGKVFKKSDLKNPLSFGSKGSLWMEDPSKMKQVEIKRDGDEIKFGNKSYYKYIGCINNPNFKAPNWHVEKKPFLLYNINPNYDLSLFEQAQCIYGIATFDE